MAFVNNPSYVYSDIKNKKPQVTKAQQAITCHSVIKRPQVYIQLVSSTWQMALDFDQSKQNAAKCEPSRHGKTQNVNVPASQNGLVSGRIKNLTTAAKLALLNYSVFAMKK